MAKDVKIRQIQHDIKVLDKAAMEMSHVKNVALKTKDTLNDISSPQQETPEEYASDKMTNTAERAVEEGVYGTKKQVNRIQKRVQKKRETDKRKAKDKNEKEYITAEQESKIKNTENTPVKTVEISEKYPIKTSDKKIVKCEGREFKTSRQVKRNEIKKQKAITENYQASMKALAKSKDIAKESAEKVAKTAKQVVVRVEKAVVASAKAIIAAIKELIVSLGVGGVVVAFLLILIVLFGGVLCMTGGDNSNTVSPVSEEVQAYEPVIRQYASQYGISEYVELIKAVMMQESGGRGLDPMQSSEGGFNTRYPRQPNGITDPDYSISCGVQELKAALVSAGVESPVDMEHIKLALQGYNFGNGYISWAKRNYGGYSLANATEFSDMKAAELGWSNYGDKQYVPHVLRYYTFGRIPTGIGSQAIVQVALSQEGNVGGQPYWSWYGFNSRVEWCACFVSWCAEQCGYIESGVIPKFSSVSAGVQWFSDRGQFRDASYVPASGDLIFFDWGNNGSVDHVGIVVNVEGGTVNTIEGNSSDKCARRSYSIGSSSIYGYGIPAY